MLKPCILIFSVSFLSACAGTQSYLRALESQGTIRTDIADDPTYDYKVAIKNKVDFNWNGGNESDRVKTVHLMFEYSCKTITVIDQIPINTGKYSTGKDAVTWIMKIKCNKY